MDPSQQLHHLTEEQAMLQQQAIHHMDPSQQMSTVQCLYCQTQLSYPSNSIYIQCPKCNHTMNPQQMTTSYVNCVGCGTLLSHPPNSVTIQCPKCFLIMDIPTRVGPQSDKTQKKKRKDPNAPKRASNAYMVFCKENRSRLKDTRPDLQFGRIGATLGDMWRNMSAEEKKPYEDKAANDRERYKKEMVGYQSESMIRAKQAGQNPPPNNGQMNLPNNFDAQNLHSNGQLDNPHSNVVPSGNTSDAGLDGSSEQVVKRQKIESSEVEDPNVQSAPIGVQSSEGTTAPPS